MDLHGLSVRLVLLLIWFYSSKKAVDLKRRFVLIVPLKSLCLPSVLCIDTSAERVSTFKDT